MHMSLSSTIIEIDRIDAIDNVVAVMDACMTDLRGWINVRCEVAEDAIRPQQSFIEQILRKNAPDAALGTWTPPEAAASTSFQHIGIQHHLGARILPELERWGIARPDGWRRVQDSPRRGFIVAIPADTEHKEVLTWLLQLLVQASRVPTTGRWIATVHSGRTK